MKLTLATIAAIVGLLALIAALTWFGLGMNRVTQPFAEETSRLTESNSRRRIDGVNYGIASLCLNMRREADPNSKRAFASLILSDAASFQRQELLTPDNQACIAEAQGY